MRPRKVAFCDACAQMRHIKQHLCAASEDFPTPCPLIAFLVFKKNTENYKSFQKKSLTVLRLSGILVAIIAKHDFAKKSDKMHNISK
jgi:hypothetical protein